MGTQVDETYETLKENIHAKEKKRIECFGQVDHLRVFGRDSEDVLRSAGFFVERIEGKEMDKAILPVLGPADYDVNYLFLCRKPVKKNDPDLQAAMAKEAE